MKKLLLTITLTLFLFLFSTLSAQATYYYEAYTGSQLYSASDESYNFGFDFWYTNDVFAVVDDAPGLELTSDASGMVKHEQLDYMTLYLDMYSTDTYDEDAFITFTFWNCSGNFSSDFSFEVHMDLQSSTSTTLNQEYAFTLDQINKFETWGWGNVAVEALFTNNDDATNDFILNRVALAGGADPGGAAPVPEPATLLLFGLGILGIAGVGRKKLQK